MKIKNSYIFLDNDIKNNINKKDDNIDLVIRIGSDFDTLLGKNFDNLLIDEKTRSFSPITTGEFTITCNSIISKVIFNYIKISKNYFLDVFVVGNKKKCIEVLSEINLKFESSKNGFDKKFISIFSYDFVSEEYCNNLFKKINNFERKLRKLLFNVYVLNFSKEYYSYTTSTELQEKIKRKSKEYNLNLSKDEKYIKTAFFSLDYMDIEKLLFTEYISEVEKQKVENILSSNENLSKLGDEKIRNLLLESTPKSDWNRFFDNKLIENNFKKTFCDIRKFRNNIAHCKNINFDEYTLWGKTIIESTKALEKAIEITETKDFINVSIKNKLETMEHFRQVTADILMKVYAPITANMTKLAEDSSEMIRGLLNPISSAWIDALSKMNFEEEEK